MGRIIRSTVTITITETWTIIWTTDEPSQPQATTTAQEKPDATTLPTITPDASTDTQPADMSPKSGTGSQRKRRRSAG